MTVHSIAFAQGVRAFINCAPTTANPYAPTTQAFNDWRAGWFTDHSPYDRRDAIAAAVAAGKAA